jgi:hypothetical protein
MQLIACESAQLLDYLGPSTAPCYISATDMIWRLDELSPSRLIESLVAERLSSGQAETRSEGFAAFGNLWRCTCASFAVFVFVEWRAEVHLLQPISSCRDS